MKSILIGFHRETDKCNHTMMMHIHKIEKIIILFLLLFYCVETICAPCGALHAWALFDKAESSTNILNFLEAVYPTSDIRPDYVCIDKACMVLCTAISNGAWNVWKETTQFIVDSYHYINH